MENEEGGMGSETGGDWNRSGVWDGQEEIRWGGGIMKEGVKKSTSVWRENGGGPAAGALETWNITTATQDHRNKKRAREEALRNP